MAQLTQKKREQLIYYEEQFMSIEQVTQTKIFEKTNSINSISSR